jgi:hypothetical protein
MLLVQNVEKLCLFLLDKNVLNHKILIQGFPPNRPAGRQGVIFLMGNGKTTTLYLMRHGETEDNVRRVIQGHNDSPLTQEGIVATRGRA